MSGDEPFGDGHVHWHSPKEKVASSKQKQNNNAIVFSPTVEKCIWVLGNLPEDKIFTL